MRLFLCHGIVCMQELDDLSHQFIQLSSDPAMHLAVQRLSRKRKNLWNQLEALINRRNALYNNTVRSETSQKGSPLVHIVLHVHISGVLVIRAVLNGLPLQGVPRHHIESFILSAVELIKSTRQTEHALRFPLILHNQACTFFQHTFFCPC